MPAILPDNISPDLRASTLAPKEPYHIPGYAGYRPQFKFQCSETFGASTHRLLTSENVRKSTNSVLRSIDPPPPRSQTVPLGFHDVPKLESEDFDISGILENRRQKLGDKLYKPGMRSGYMGFVPKAHFSSYHSRTFPEICNSALKDFSEDQETCKRKMQSLHWTMQLQEAGHLTSSQRENLLTSETLPLRPIRASLPPYRSPNAFRNPEPSYFLKDGHPDKHFRSGFAGHVPFYKDLGGHGFPTVTNQALTEFTKERDRIMSSPDKPMNPKSVLQPRPPRKILPFSSQTQRQQVFLVDSGIIPRYAGYVPGQKYRFGHTFGQSTQNPLNVKNPVPVPVMTS